MKKNEAINFFKAYKNSVCLDEHLQPIKLLDYSSETSGVSFAIIRKDGSRGEILATVPIIALKGRLKSRDYDLIENKFNLSLQSTDKT